MFSQHTVKIIADGLPMPLIDKQNIRRQLRTAFIDDGTIEKIVILGSFITSESPNDLDLAVFCNSSDDYLTLSLALRKKLRDISSIIPIDLVPIAMPYGPSAAFMQEINCGEVVYEKDVKLYERGGQHEYR